MQQTAVPAADLKPANDPLVRQFRHILLWPLQLEPAFCSERKDKPWELLNADAADSLWKPQEELCSDSAPFNERHYSEFVTFLPYVRRFLYGESRSRQHAGGLPRTPAAMRAFVRRDVSDLRIRIWPQSEAILLKVQRLALHFFRDIDVVLFAVELEAQDLPLSAVKELLYRFGRAYPASWHKSGQGMHNVYSAEWLDAKGSVLARSNSEQREDFIDFVRAHRAPRLAAHWAFLLKPLVPDVSDEAGALRFRQIEYHRMPLMSYLSLDDPRALTREDFVQLGLVAYLRPGDPISARDPAVAEFEARYCDDRYWLDTEQGPNSRIICTGHALLAIGESGSGFFGESERGMLAQFRHPYFLVFLIAHFHRAALLVFSDRLAAAINALDSDDADSVRAFRQRIRTIFAAFLRFTHRYWFTEISERGQTQHLFRRTSSNLGNPALLDQIKERVRDMSDYLDSDSQRRQSNTVVRLTVVTTFGMIGTVATGFLGMNLIAAAEAPLTDRLSFFLIVSLGAAFVTFYAVAKSRQLSDFLEALSDDRIGTREKFAAFRRAVWRRKPRRQ